MAELIDIDGSILEGGGQILRNSIALSAILGVPVRISKIRAARRKPGLAAQHLKGVQLVAEMCQAKLKGAQIGSTEIEFIPGKIKGGHYLADIKTAGSISLLIQVALPVALLADGPITIDMKGGTNADLAPQIDYMTDVFRPLFKMFGEDFQLEIHRRGYYPRGGGHVTLHVTPSRRLTSVNVTEQGNVTGVRGRSYVAGVLPVKMAYQLSEGVKSRLNSVPHVDIHSYKEERHMAPDNSCGIIVTAETSSGCILGSDGLCNRGVDPYELGCQVGDTLRDVIQSGACVDTHAQDQLVLYMALADGESIVRTSELTLHTKTAVHIAETIAKIKFNVEPIDNNYLIKCTGLGLVNKNLPPQ